MERWPLDSQNDVGLNLGAVSGFRKGSEGKFAEANWKQSVGRMTQEMANEHLYKSSNTALALFCGPPPMITYAAKPFCQQLGYTEDTMVIF